MRDALNLNFLPIVQDEMNGISVKAGANKGFSNISNGYYGYQPLPNTLEDKTVKYEQMDIQQCDMEMQFSSEGDRKQYPRIISRKRAWEYNTDSHYFKKRREDFGEYCYLNYLAKKQLRAYIITQNDVRNSETCFLSNFTVNIRHRNDGMCIVLISEPDLTIPVLPASNKTVSYRHPTHNMPDISRCMMGHYI